MSGAKPQAEIEPRSFFVSANEAHPSTGPDARHPDDIAPPRSYHRGQRVWVWSSPFGRWLPGVVERMSATAAGITYQLPGGGTANDDVMPKCLVARPTDVPTGSEVVTHDAA
jgi:hypothetical protein